MLLPQKQACKGTGIIKADVNGDGLEDFFVGNASAASQAYISKKTMAPLLQPIKTCGILKPNTRTLTPSDNDGDQDLYVVSAGYDLGENNPLLQDQFYQNNGSGTFTVSKNPPSKNVKLRKNCSRWGL